MYTSVDKIEFELTTACNAWCPGCSRYHAADDGLMLSPFVEFNQHISLTVIENVLDNEILSEGAELQFCGTAGDPLAHPKFLEIVEIIKAKRPDVWLSIHTNGGLKTPDYFNRLARILTNRDEIKFNVDGLADTNHIYRRNVTWERIVENAKAFNKNKKCHSEWQYIVFPWNEHQTHQAQELSAELGFDEFNKRMRREDNETLEYQMKAADNGLINQVSHGDYLLYFPPEPTNGYRDLCFSQNGIFVNQNGIVHPCCDFASSINRPGKMSDQIKEFYGNSDWNDLNYHNLQEIMKNDFWSRLHNSLYGQGERCGQCNHRCGVNQDKPHWDNML